MNKYKLRCVSRSMTPELEVMANNLNHAIERFATVLGVVVIKMEDKYDSNGILYCAAHLGNDQYWIAFRSEHDA